MAQHLFSLKIENFRNIAKEELFLSPALNLFYGQNGMGKTNFLEAISMACQLRPLQSLKNEDLIRYGENQATLSGRFFDPAHDIDITVMPIGKKARLNEKTIKNAFRLHEAFPLISFVPLELNMIFLGGSLRRRALDMAVSQIHLEHVRALKAYDKILKSRNYLLKNTPWQKDEIHVFTKMLIEEGTTIIGLRKSFIDALLPCFQAAVKDILGHDHTASIEYQWEGWAKTSSTSLDEDFQNVKVLEEKRRVTLFGPHLHDIDFLIDNMLAKVSSSRGQSRALVLAFKLASLNVINQFRGLSPVVLLDDIVSELDEEKRNRLLKVIDDLQCQAIFTMTEKTLSFDVSSSIKHYRVEQGRALLEPQ